MTPRIRIGTPTDILHAVPALLGFYPTESLVALFVNGSRLNLIARYNLPTNEPAPHSNQPAWTITDLCAGLTDTLTRHDTAILVLYSADHEAAHATIRTAIAQNPAKIGHAILATINGWTTVDPEQPDITGRTNPYPTQTSDIAAELAAAGLHAAGTRDDLADSIQAPDPDTAADYHLGRALDPIPTHPTHAQQAQLAAEAAQWVTSYLRRPTTVVPEEAAYIAQRVHHGSARDAVAQLLDTTTAAALTTMWQAVAALTPDHDANPVLGCLALTAWISGNGTLANLAITRAETLPAGPGNRLLNLVATALHHQIPPTRWDELKNTL